MTTIEAATATTEAWVTVAFPTEEEEEITTTVRTNTIDTPPPETSPPSTTLPATTMTVTLETSGKYVKKI